MLCLESLKEVKKMVSLGEVKSTIATAIAAAFGFVIALTWNQIIQGLIKYAGITITAVDSVKAAITVIITGVVLTVICILGILYISKWGGVGAKK
jgi:hypothetical protein